MNDKTPLRLHRWIRLLQVYDLANTTNEHAKWSSLAAAQTFTLSVVPVLQRAVNCWKYMPPITRSDELAKTTTAPQPSVGFRITPATDALVSRAEYLELRGR